MLSIRIRLSAVAVSASQVTGPAMRTLGVACILAVSLSGAAVAQGRAVRQACAGDFKTYCSNVQPGGGRILACLQQNAAKLPPACQQALASRGKR